MARSLSDYYNHVSLWNRVAGINPTPSRLEFEMPQDVKEPKYRRIPPVSATATGQTWMIVGPLRSGSSQGVTLQQTRVLLSTST